jgi:hypothetical protein
VLPKGCDALRAAQRPCRPIGMRQAATTIHYAAGVDSPSWTKSSTAAVSRDVTDHGGMVLQLANLHGDIAVQLPLDAGPQITVPHPDGFGCSRDGITGRTYGWLGAYQCNGAMLGGFVLMVQHLYARRPAGSYSPPRCSAATTTPMCIRRTPSARSTSTA